ncbi:MAG: hypothetical protein ACAH80_00520 [Alphaproteobacteria bacterium]
MKYAFVLMLICGFFLTPPAQACWRGSDLEHINKKMDTTFPNADVVFIGTLIEIKDHKEFIFKIEKGIKNAVDGNNHTALLGPGMTYCDYDPIGGLFLYIHHPAKEVPPAPPPSEEFLRSFSSDFETPEENWVEQWKMKYAEMGFPTLIRVWGKYYPSDAAFIKEQFGYDITVGADKPQKEKSE